MGKWVYIPDGDDGPPDAPPFEPITVQFWQESDVPTLVAEGGTIPLSLGLGGPVVGRIIAGEPSGDGCLLTAEVSDRMAAARLAVPAGVFSISGDANESIVVPEPASPSDG